MSTAQAQPPQPFTTRIATLKRRPEFLRIRNGGRFATPAFVLEGKRREEGDQTSSAGGPRFGFTVSKKVGSAVERNRIKRRLKAAVRDVVRDHARGDFDYVLIARRAALDAGFAALVSDLIKSLGRVHAKPGEGRRSGAARSTVRGS
jgi:ribonuclease P protein component